MLPQMASQTTRDNPWPVSLVTAKLKQYIDRTVPMWVSGQVVSYSRRAGRYMQFFTVRDLEGNQTMNAKCSPDVINEVGSAFEAGTRIIMRCKPDFWEGKGDLSLWASEIHVEGIGGILEQIKRLAQKLTREGLFQDRHKQQLPHIPRKIGLVCGHNAKAQRDVIDNTFRRWPTAQFEIREVKVQGDQCVPQVIAAMRELDTIDDVDVIVVTRGGGAAEDLFPFSDERMVRAAFALTTPLVSAIGHETDCPLLDNVADYRASTPTDAARRIVPDVGEEIQALQHARHRLLTAIGRIVDNEIAIVRQLQSAPVLQDPTTVIQRQVDLVTNWHQRMRQHVKAKVDVEMSTVNGYASTLRALSPQSIFDRGFSLVRKPGGAPITDAGTLKKGDLLETVFAQGSAVVTVFGTNPETEQGQPIQGDTNE